MAAVVLDINYRLWQPWLMKRLIKKIDMDSHNLLGLFWNNLLDIHHSILSPSILFNNQRQIIDFCSVLALSLPENESSIIELRIKHSKLIFPGWSWFDLVWFGWWPGWSCTAERWSAPSTSADYAGVHPPQLWGWNLPMAWDSVLHIWQRVSSGFPFLYKTTWEHGSAHQPCWAAACPPRPAKEKRTKQENNAIDLN